MRQQKLSTFCMNVVRRQRIIVMARRSQPSNAALAGRRKTFARWEGTHASDTGAARNIWKTRP